MVSAGEATAPAAEGLRARKKRLTRQLISDTATALFLERGFDVVRISDISAACDLSEKTVYNYFPSKESLVLDEEDQVKDAVRAAAADPDTPPLRAMVGVIEREMRQLPVADAAAGAAAMAAAGRFFDLVEQTPSLRAHHREGIDRLADTAADSLAERSGLPRDSPEVQATAHALVSLRRIQVQSLRRHVAGASTPAGVVDLVLADVRRAAQLLEDGLSTFT